MTEPAVLVLAGVFTRIAAALFLVPGVGEQGIPLRVRLGAAVAITMILAPLVAPLVPLAPSDGEAVARMLAAEALVGLTIGLGFRLLVYALQIAGTIAAMHLSLSHIFGSATALEGEQTIATFLAMGGVVLAFNAGLHIAVVAALGGLYEVLPFGEMPLRGPIAELSVLRMAEVFALGFALAAPFVAISFVYNLVLGAISRAMPQLLVALIGVPLLVGLGMITLWAALPSLFDRWGEALARVLADPLGRLL